MKTTLYLIRHGNINCVDCIPGRTPGLYLSSKGREQAVSISNFFKTRRLDLIFSSPLERTIETAKPLATEKNLQINTDDSFLEIDFGDWTGKNFNELEFDNRWKQFHFFRNGCKIPSGELMIEVQSRIVNRIEALRKRYEGKSIAVFSHNDLIKSVIAFYLGISLDLFLRIIIDTGSISIIEFEDEQVEVAAINRTPE